MGLQDNKRQLKGFMRYVRVDESTRTKEAGNRLPGNPGKRICKNKTGKKAFYRLLPCYNKV